MDFKDFIKTYPNFKDCSIQTFDDDSSRKSQELAKIYPVSSVDWQLVKNLNTAGAGVFFSVNSMKKGRRDKSSVTNLNTWIVESDELSKQEQDNLINNAPLKPSCIIESEKSYHIYYFAENATLNNRERINRGLKEYYHGDGSICSDTARVLRVPGTYHNKGEPYKIVCKYCEDVKYKEEDMLQSFPYVEVIKEKKEIKEVKKNIVTKARNIRELMGMQSSRYMLDRLSSSRLVKGESISYQRNSDGTDQIFIDGRSTGAWIDNNDYIGSAKDGGPTRIQWCQYYGNSKGDIAKWFVEFCDDLIPHEFNRTVQIKEIQKIEEEEIKEKAIKERDEKLRHISYEEKILKGFDELINTDPNKVMKWGWTERDHYLGGIYGGKVYLIGADTGCVDSETEYLTPEGWKKISDYTYGDLVGEYDTDSRECVFKKPINYIKEEQEYGIRIKNKSIDMLLTPEHRVLYNTKNGVYHTKELSEIIELYKNNPGYTNIHIPNTFKINKTKGIDMSNDEIKLMVAIIADGHFKKDTKTKRCRINIKKENKKKRLRILLNKCGIEYKEVQINPKDLSYSTFKFYAPRRDKIFDSYYWGCNTEQLKIISEEVVYWDGSIDKRLCNSKRYYTTIKDSADFIQYAFVASGCKKVSLGKSARQGTEYCNGYIRKSDDYIVGNSGTKKIGSVNIRYDDFLQEKMTDGYKYCFTTSTSYWIARRNGKIFITGNCGKSTFVNQVAKNLASTGIAVTRYSLEDRMEDNAKEDIYYMTNQYRSKKGKSKLEWTTYINGEYTRQGSKKYDADICNDLTEAAMEIMKINITELEKNKDVTIDDLAELMNEECDKGTRVFIIDHLHYFQFENDKIRMDLQIENAMKRINEVARMRDVAVFLVAHYNSSGGNGQPTLNSFKGSTGIKQIANIVIQISREEDMDETVFKVSKLRGPIKKKDIVSTFDLSTYEYSFTKTKEQKEKEEKIKISFNK